MPLGRGVGASEKRLWMLLDANEEAGIGSLAGDVLRHCRNLLLRNGGGDNIPTLFGKASDQKNGRFRIITCISEFGVMPGL